MTELKKLDLEIELTGAIEAISAVIVGNQSIESGQRMSTSILYGLNELRSQYLYILQKRQRIDVTKLTDITAHNVAVEITVARSAVDYIDNSLSYLNSSKF